MSTTPALETRKVTMYVRGEFMGNYKRIECKAYAVSVGKYAQYNAAVHAYFQQPRQRLVRGFVQHFRPSLVVLDGWGHVEPPSMWGKSRTENGMTVTEARYSACDDRWDSDFSATLDAYIASSGANVLHDFRGHASC